MPIGSFVLGDSTLVGAFVSGVVRSNRDLPSNTLFLDYGMQKISGWISLDIGGFVVNFVEERRILFAQSDPKPPIDKPVFIDCDTIRNGKSIYNIRLVGGTIDGQICYIFAENGGLSNRGLCCQ